MLLRGEEREVQRWRATVWPYLTRERAGHKGCLMRYMAILSAGASRVSIYIGVVVRLEYVVLE